MYVWYVSVFLSCATYRGGCLMRGRGCLLNDQHLIPWARLYRVDALWNILQFSSWLASAIVLCMYACMFLISNNYFQASSKVFHQIIGICVSSDIASFFANLFFLFHESKLQKSIYNVNNRLARKFGNIFIFINNHNEIYFPELTLKKENSSHKETAFLDLHLHINEGQMQICLYDKRNSYILKAVSFLYKSSSITSKTLLQPLVPNYLGSAKQLPLWCSLLKHLRLFYAEYFGRGQTFQV